MSEQAATPIRAERGIQRRVQKDRFDNDVSLVTIADGRTFRMVHHSKPFHSRKRATIYAGRGKFVKLTTFSCENDCMEETFDLAGYRQAWGDGEGFQSDPHPNGPDLSLKLAATYGADFDECILLVLEAIADLPHMWETKDVLPKAA